MNDKDPKSCKPSPAGAPVEDCPPGWRLCYSARKKHSYYFNIETGESSWEKPKCSNQEAATPSRKESNTSEKGPVFKSPDVPLPDLSPTTGQNIKGKRKSEDFLSSKPTSDSEKGVKKQKPDDGALLPIKKTQIIGVSKELAYVSDIKLPTKKKTLSEKSPKKKQITTVTEPSVNLKQDKKVSPSRLLQDKLKHTSGQTKLKSSAIQFKIKSLSKLDKVPVNKPSILQTGVHLSAPLLPRVVGLGKIPKIPPSVKKTFTNKTNQQTAVGTGHTDPQTVHGTDHTDQPTAVGTCYFDQRTVHGTDRTDLQTVDGTESTESANQKTAVGTDHWDQQTVVGAHSTDQQTVIGAHPTDQQTASDKKMKPFKLSPRHKTVTAPLKSLYGKHSMTSLSSASARATIDSLNVFPIKVSSGMENESHEEEMDVEEADSHYEVMMMDIGEIRQKINDNHVGVCGTLTGHMLNAPAALAGVNNSLTSQPEFLYVIVDTNVLISHPSFIDELKDRYFPGLGFPNLVIPWMVLQELDAMKDNKKGRNNSNIQLNLVTQAKARQAVAFLNRCLESRHPRVKGQTPQQASRAISNFTAESNDDRILHCCLQWAKECPTSEIVLLTLDKNLRNKSLVSGIASFTKEGLLSWLSKKSAGVKDIQIIPRPLEKDDMSLQASHGTNKSTVLLPNRDLQLADDALCQIKQLLKTPLETVLETEMKSVYGDLWKEIVFKKPPWTLQDLIVSLEKHWIAVFGLILDRDNQTHLENIREVVTPGKGYGKSIAEVVRVIKTSIQLLDALYLHSSYGGTIKRAVASLNTILEKLKEVGTSAISVKTASSGAQVIQEDTQTSGQNDLNSAHNDLSYDVSHQNAVVQQVFQLTWEAIAYYCDLLQNEVKSTCHMGCLRSRRQAAVQAVAEFTGAVAAIRTGYLSMLSVPPSSASLGEEQFHQICKSLHHFAQVVKIELPHMEIGYLLTYFMDTKNREILRTGFNQLEGMIQNLVGIKDHLTPAELAKVDSFNQPADNIS